MANPKTFVSSTCYDLQQVRDNLFSFIQSFGHDPILSERGDVFFHPALHTHESCLREVENCQLLILIIGGRFGGKYIADPSKSIVNAEYLAAKSCKIPVFCFIKREVYTDHNVYESNKSDPNLISQINFPSIEKREHAIKIFEFINDVRHSPVNNGIFPFDFARDIEDVLRKQWAGLLFDYLTEKRKSSEFEVTSRLLENLTIASKKSEELIKTLFTHIDKTEAKSAIVAVDKEFQAMEFFQHVVRTFHIERFSSKMAKELTNLNRNVPWYDFLVSTGDFEIHKDVLDARDSHPTDIVVHKKNSSCVSIAGNMNHNEKKTAAEFAALYEKVKSLTPAEYGKVIEKFSYPF